MVTVVIPTLNPGIEIVKLLVSLREQTIPCEIIIADSSSRNGFCDIARSINARVIVIKRHEFDHGGTRTLAGRQATRDIVVYMTQDAFLEGRDALEKLIEPFHHDAKIAATFGRQLPNGNSTSFASHLRQFNYPPESYVRSMDDNKKYGIKAAFLSNGFAAYCKKALERIGWFKDGLIVCEDTYAGIKLLTEGYKIAYVADAVVYHSHNYTITQEAKRYFDIGVFHKMEKRNLREFGMPEKEGIRYLTSGLSYLMKNHRPHLIPAFIMRGSLKYVAYKLGQNYEKIPKNFIKKISMHKDWWNRS